MTRKPSAEKASTYDNPGGAVGEYLDERHLKVPIGIMSRRQKLLELDRLIQRITNRYEFQAQTGRHWHPDYGFVGTNNSDDPMKRRFRWDLVRPVTDPDLIAAFKMNLGTEQYTPDYVTELITQSIRDKFGRSQAHLFWGYEESRHAALARRVLIATKVWTEKEADMYIRMCRAHHWRLPDSNPFFMSSYTCTQEKATYLVYYNIAKILLGKIPEKEHLKDPHLAFIFQAIAGDEAGHNRVFLDFATAQFLFFPDEFLEQMRLSYANFAMPGKGVLPDYEAGENAMIRAGIFGGRDLVRAFHSTFDALGVTNGKAILKGIAKSRTSPDQDGNYQTPTYIEGFNFNYVKGQFDKLVRNINTFEAAHGFGIEPFVPQQVYLTE